MSGLLHRLAAQAMGRTSTLRSTARLPYAASAFAEPMDDADLQGNPPRTHERPRAPWHAVEQDKLRGGPSGEINVSVRGDEITAARLQVNTAQGDADFTSELQDRKIVLSAAVPPQASSADHAAFLIPIVQPKAAPEDSEPGRHIAGSPDIQSAPEKPENNTGHNTESKRSESVRFQHAGRKPEHSESKHVLRTTQGSDISDPHLPSPLLPLNDTLATPSAQKRKGGASSRDPQGASRQEQIEETTEVHVHIGRIEVTAVHEQAPLKRQTRTTQKTMTLDDYLARRRSS